MQYTEPEIQELRKISELKKITKGTLPRLYAANGKAKVLIAKLESKTSDESTVRDFKTLSEEADTALDDLENSCNDLEGAEDKDEREAAIDQINDAVREAIFGFESLVDVARIRQ